MTSPTERFTECWHTDGPRVLAYASRHVGREHAQEIVAETFMIAWRRWDAVPQPPIAWLIATARGVIRNHRRTVGRQRALESRIALLEDVSSPDTTESALVRQDALQRLTQLTAQHREALLLTSWDGLSAEEAAEALGIRPAAFRRRLSRARQNLLTRPPNPATTPRTTTALAPTALAPKEIS